MYLASSDGEVWSVARSRWLAKRAHPQGYYVVCLLDKNGRRKTWKVARIIVTAFYGPRGSDMCVAHGDGTRTNDHLENLRWATQKENAADRLKHGRDARGQKERGGSPH